MERVRLFLRLRERLKQQKPQQQAPNAVKTPVSPTEPKFPIPQTVQLNEREKAVANKVLNLVNLRIPVNKEPPTGLKVSLVIRAWS